MSNYFNHIDPDNIDLDNLPPELQAMVAVMLTIQYCGNRPACMGDLMIGLYGKKSDLTPEQQDECCQQFAAVMLRLFSLGWISDPTRGDVILTDLGDEKATVLRNYYEAAGIIDFSRLT